MYAVLAFLTDAPQMAAALRSFPCRCSRGCWRLSSVSFVVRGVRWGALMRVIGYPVSTRDALYLQFSGQTMSVTPGRVGEVLKPWLASKITEMPMTRGVALVFSERLADLIAVCFLSLGGLSTIGGSMWVLLLALVGHRCWHRRGELQLVSRIRPEVHRAPGVVEEAPRLGDGHLGDDSGVADVEDDAVVGAIVGGRLGP